MIIYLFFSCFKCVREDGKDREKHSIKWKSIRSERNDGYITFSNFEFTYLVSATCNNLNVSFIIRIFNLY